MLIHQKAVLNPAQVAHCRTVLEAAAWVDGKATAGAQSARTKHNLQIPLGAPAAKQLGDLVLDALGRNPGFITAALPLKVLAPMFNRYDVGMDFGPHIDNAIRFNPEGVRYRADVACTLFLSDPADYDGGDLVIEGSFGVQRVKLPAGDMVIYPASSVHRVEPVTRGSRWASFFWVQSMVRDDGQRTLLHALDRHITETRGALGDDHAAAVGLTGVYHNLVRMWADS